MLPEIITKHEPTDDDIKKACNLGIFLSIPLCAIYIPLSIFSDTVDRLSVALSRSYGFEAIFVIISLILFLLAMSLIQKYFGVLSKYKENVEDAYYSLCGAMATIVSITLSVIIIVGICHLGFSYLWLELKADDIGGITSTLLKASLQCMTLLIASVLFARVYSKMGEADEDIKLKILAIVLLIISSYIIALI